MKNKRIYQPIILLTIFLLSLLFVSCKKSQSTINLIDASKSGHVSISGHGGYFIKNSGELITLDGEISSLVATPDKKYLAVLYSNGDLSYIDTETLEEVFIDTEVVPNRYYGKVYPIKNQGFVYSKNKSVPVDTILQAIEEDNKDGYTALSIKLAFFEEPDNLTVEVAEYLYKEIVGRDYRPPFVSHRYLIGQDNTVEYQYDDYAFSDNSLHCLFVSENRLCFLMEDGKDVQKIQNYSDNETINPIGISNDGSIMAWYVISENEKSDLYLWENGETTKVESSLSINANTSISVNHFFKETDSGDIIITIQGWDTVFIKEKSKDIQKIFLNEPITSVSGAANLAKKFELFDGGFFVQCNEEELGTLFFVKDGDKQKIASSIGFIYGVTDDRIYYSTACEKFASRNLYVAEFRDLAIHNEEQVAQDVLPASFSISSDGKTAFYSADKSLYRYEDGKKPIWIADDILEFSFFVNADFSSVVFVQNGEKIADTYSTKGDLAIWTVENGKEILDCNVMRINTGYKTQIADLTNIEYCKYDRMKDDTIVCDLYHYNGKETTRTATDIKY